VRHLIDSFERAKSTAILAVGMDLAKNLVTDPVRPDAFRSEQRLASVAKRNRLRVISRGFALLEPSGVNRDGRLRRLTFDMSGMLCPLDGGIGRRRSGHSGLPRVLRTPGSGGHELSSVICTWVSTVSTMNSASTSAVVCSRFCDGIRVCHVRLNLAARQDTEQGPIPSGRAAQLRWIISFGDWLKRCHCAA
jgi:hypothetical protein